MKRAPLPPAERQYVRQNYLTASEREGGLTHLWHMERLAQLRLNTEPKVVDVAAEIKRDEERHRSQQRSRERAVAAEERALYEANQTLFRHLCAATDAKNRRSRHMQLCPPPGSHEAAVDAAAAEATLMSQLNARQRARQRHEQAVVRQNRRLLRHIIQVKPGVRTARQYADWYNKEHKKRLQQLSRFKKAEPFAGAAILERECGVRLRPAETARLPLVAGQPHPPPSIGETLASRHLPRSLLPPLLSTTYGGVALHTAGSDDGRPQSAQRGGRRPSWQNIAVTDIPLMHYVSDRVLTEPTEVVREEEEGGCTRLWRGRVCRGASSPAGTGEGPGGRASRRSPSQPQLTPLPPSREGPPPQRGVKAHLAASHSTSAAASTIGAATQSVAAPPSRPRTPPPPAAYSPSPVASTASPEMEEARPVTAANSLLDTWMKASVNGAFVAL